MLDSEVLASKLLLRAFGRAVLIQNGSENRQEQNAGVDERLRSYIPIIVDANQLDLISKILCHSRFGS